MLSLPRAIDRLLIALKLKRPPEAVRSVRTMGIATLMPPALTRQSGSVGGSLRSKTQHPSASKIAAVQPRRRVESSDDGFPDTMMLAFPDSATPMHRARHLAAEEADVPLPFRSLGGGDFGGGGGSGSWDRPEVTSGTCVEHSSPKSSWGGESQPSYSSYGSADSGSCSSTSSSDSSSSSSSSTD